MMHGTNGYPSGVAVSLSEFQRHVASIAFSVAEADGFALAGGGALIAHEIVDRTTKDLDCFGPSRDAVDRFWPAMVKTLEDAGLKVEVHVASHGFAKLSVADPKNSDRRTQVDVGFDPAGHEAVSMTFGPVRAIEDLAADKLLALFGRAAARDFVDVHALRQRFTRREMEIGAQAKDRGFSLDVLADAFGVLGSLPRSGFEVNDATFALLAEEFTDWQAQLRA
jgi:Nucleotidyl transferase AbiEii toxin, Type IV TA system